MSVFRVNVHLGGKDPLIETDDISNGAVTLEKTSIADATSDLHGYMSAEDKEYLDTVPTLISNIQTDVQNNDKAIQEEIERAEAAEQANTDAITTEATTARAAEKANADAIAAEAATARAAEQDKADKTDIITGATVIPSESDIYTTLDTIEGVQAAAFAIPSATTSKAGVMSKADKAKLDGIATGATANKGTVTSVNNVTPDSSGNVALSISNNIVVFDDDNLDFEEYGLMNTSDAGEPVAASLGELLNCSDPDGITISGDTLFKVGTSKDDYKYYYHHVGTDDTFGMGHIDTEEGFYDVCYEMIYCRDTNKVMYSKYKNVLALHVGDGIYYNGDKF